MELPKEIGLQVIQEYPTLYCRDKRKKIRVFECTVYSTTAKKGLIVSKTGGFGNKLVEKKKNIVKGKNLNKANATTAVEQAVSDADSMWRKKIKEGYKSIGILGTLTKPFQDTIYYKDPNGILPYLNEYLPQFNTDDNNRPKPMLAEKWKGKNSFPIHLQAKYNGVRCISFIEDDKVVTLSREGTTYDVIHIANELPKLFMIASNLGYSDIMFDGELYCHGKPLQEIASLVKTPTMLSGELTYEIYDVAFLQEGKNKYLSQAERAEVLSTIFKMYGSPSITRTVKRVYTHICHSLDDVKRNHMENIKNGYEGSILRPLNKPYAFSFRDSALQKIKETISAEFSIVGHSLEPGKPIHDFTITCITPEGRRFDVKPHGTVAEREILYHTMVQHIGKNLQLTFHEYTKDKIPFHVTEVVIRDYE